MNGNGLKTIAGIGTTVIAGLLLAIIVRAWSVPDDLSSIKTTLTFMAKQIEENKANIDRLRGWESRQ